MSEPTSSPPVAYVAEGKLYVTRNGGPAQLIDSPFVQGILDRAERNRAKNDWKSEGMAWNLGNRGRMPFGAMPAPADVRRVRFTGVTSAGTDGSMFYAIDTDHVGGLFHYTAADGYERRLLHRQQFRATDLTRHPTDGTLAFTIRAADGTAHLATMSPEGRGFKEITEGDAIDEAPAWVDGGARKLVFQSAGVGRNEHGFPTGFSPYAVHVLDLDGGKMEILLEEESSDLLLPRMSGDGTLYFIRRPYQPHGPPVSPLKVGLDMLLFPFRLGRAVLHFLNVFSLMFSRKPLMTAGGPPKEGPDQRYLMLWGRMIDAEKALRDSKEGPGGALVPATWQLVRRTPTGNETILAKHVLAYDLCPDGKVVYTDGSKLHLLNANGEVTTLGRGKLVERLAALG